MTKKNTLAGLTILVAISLLISACGGNQPAAAATPTVDANMVYTQAAQTDQASIAQTDAVKPQAPATNTPEPTNTMDPNVAAAMTATSKAVLQPGSGNTTPAASGQATTAPGQPTPTTASVLPLPTATTAVVAPPPKPKGDKAELIGQDPADDTHVGKKDVVSVALTFKNTGTTTWKKATYKLVYYAGDRMGSPYDYQMPHEVKPGETITIQFQLTAPNSSGDKQIIWVLQNSDGLNFYTCFLKLSVG